MTNLRRARLVLFAALSSATIGCDRVAKAAASDALRDGAPRDYAGGLLRLGYAENTGAFLGLGGNLDPTLRTGLLGIAAAIGIAVTAAVLLKRRAEIRSSTLVAVTLIVSGGAANVFDRLVRGYVVDFAIVGLGPLRTGVFNLADVAITAGALVLLVAGPGRRLRRELAPPEGATGTR
jgi:signal peptidase II